jgi:regulatory protein
MAKIVLPDSSISIPAEIIDRISSYCAYQERCIFDVQQKLNEWKVLPDKIIPIIKYLEDNNFIDQARFARMFTRGKFLHNKWGRIKIHYELRIRSIPENLIREAFAEISEEDYKKTIRELILKKKPEIKGGKNLNIRQKIINFVTGKGFEFDLTSEVLKEFKI